MARKLVNLKDNNDILVPQVFGAIDTSNVLQSQTISGTLNFVASQDCYFIILGGRTSMRSIYFNGIEIAKINEETKYITALKQNDKLTGSDLGNSANYVVYGLKY